MKNETKKQKISFYAKTATSCPVCDVQFFREDLYTGRGRLIAGELTNELQRLYQPSQRFGAVFPLAYNIAVCPSCLFAVMPQDLAILPANTAAILAKKKEEREESLDILHESCNFNEPRNLIAGLASHILAMYTYEHFPDSLAPMVKQGICSLRAAWLSHYMHETYPEENYNYLELFFYRKACYCYNMAWELDNAHKQALHHVTNLGPDIDKNFGFDGFMLVMATLNLKHGQKVDMKLRVENLKNVRLTVSKMFGIGKTSKSKPTALLMHAEDLHEDLKKEIEHIELSMIHA